jgi:hypothetical protein
VTIAPPPQDIPRARAGVPVRFEDVTQDGRFVLEALPNAVGPAIWQAIIQKDPGFIALFNNGLLPMLTRFELEGTAGPFSAHATVEAEGACCIVRTEEGPEVRFVLEMWADLYAPIGRTYGSARRQGERALAGRMRAEQTFTRPFAPPGERRVTSLDFPGAAPVHSSRPPSPPGETVASLPSGATPLEPAPAVDPFPVVFGLVHTDSNRHINSLAYLRMFEEAALRRFAELGKTSSWLGRSLEIVYRRPCFAGQSMRVVQQAFEQDGKLGIAATLVGAEDTVSPEALAKARPHTFVKILFEGPT